MRILEWAREWRGVLMKLKTHKRTLPAWQTIKMFLDSVKPSLKIKCEHLDDFSKLDQNKISSLVWIANKLKDLELKERKKHAAHLKVATADLDAALVAQNFDDVSTSSKDKPDPATREARMMAANARNHANQMAENARKGIYKGRGRAKGGRGRGRSGGRGGVGHTNSQKYGARNPKIKSGQFQKQYNQKVWSTRRRATAAHLAPSNFPYCYENDCMAISVSGNLEDVPVCVICHTAKPKRQGGHQAHECPREKSNLENGFFQPMPDGCC